MFIGKNLGTKAKERKERKDMYISYVLSKAHGSADEDEIIKEASKKFDDEQIHNS